MTITLVIEVPRLSSIEEGKQFASVLADQIYAAQINDDGAIHRITSRVDPGKKGKAHYEPTS